MQPVKPFSLIAQVYDAIMDDIDYDGWADFILETVKTTGWQGKRILDLGCGTGNSSFPFFAKGYELVGLDASEEMLTIAREKLPPVRFVAGDFKTFDLGEHFDLVVSVFDSLNNLLRTQDFIQTARQVYKHLNPNGIFMFDVNTTIGLKDLWESGCAEGWVNDVYYRWEHSFDEKTGLAKVEAYCENGRQSFTEVHYERPYDAPELKGFLAQAGFTDIQVLTYPFAMLAPEDADRIWVLAKKVS